MDGLKIPVQWDDSLSIGVEAVDGDHKILVSLVGQILGAIDAPEADVVIGSVINALVDYTRYHFAREEALQEAVGYPGLARHRVLHEDLKATAVSMQQRFLADPASVDPAQLTRFLVDWLTHHIMQEDKAIAPYAVGRPEAEAAAAAVNFMDVAGIDMDNLDDDPFLL